MAHDINKHRESRSDVMNIAVGFNPRNTRSINIARRVSDRIILMANTYSHCYNDIVFSTKDRFNWIKPPIEQLVWAGLQVDMVCLLFKWAVLTTMLTR